MAIEWRVVYNSAKQPQHASLDLMGGFIQYEIWNYADPDRWRLTINREHIKYYKTFNGAARGAEAHARRLQKKLNIEVVAKEIISPAIKEKMDELESLLLRVLGNEANTLQALMGLKTENEALQTRVTALERIVGTLQSNLADLQGAEQRRNARF